MNPSGLKRFRRYQNDEQVKEQKWNAKFKRLTKVFYETSNETRNEIMQNRIVLQQTMSDMCDGLKTRVEISEKKVLKIDSHVVKSDKKVEKIASQVEKIASRVEKIASEKAMSDKRFDYLEKQFKSMSHLQKSSRTKQRKEKDDDCTRKTRPIHKTKEKESRLRRSRHSDNESSQSSSPRFRSLSPPDLTGSIIQQLDSNTNANSHPRPQSRGTAEQRGLLPLSNAQLQALDKGSNCVNFIGNLVIESYPEGYFLVKENSFKTAVSSLHLKAFFEIVSSKYTHIQRRGQPIKQLTMSEMWDVMRNRVNWYRRKNRLLIE